MKHANLIHSSLYSFIIHRPVMKLCTKRTNHIYLTGRLDAVMLRVELTDSVSAVGNSA